MKKLKEYFNMVVTAVICLAMSLITGKNREKVVKVLGTGGMFSRGHIMKSCIVTERIPGYISAGQAPGNNILSDLRGNSYYNSDMKIKEMRKKKLHSRQKIRADTLQRHAALPSVGPGDRAICKLHLRSDDRKIIIFPTWQCEENVYSASK